MLLFYRISFFSVGFVLVLGLLSCSPDKEKVSGKPEDRILLKVKTAENFIGLKGTSISHLDQISIFWQSEFLLDVSKTKKFQEYELEISCLDKENLRHTSRHILAKRHFNISNYISKEIFFRKKNKAVSCYISINIKKDGIQYVYSTNFWFSFKTQVYGFDGKPAKKVFVSLTKKNILGLMAAIKSQETELWCKEKGEFKNRSLEWEKIAGLDLEAQKAVIFNTVSDSVCQLLFVGGKFRKLSLKFQYKILMEVRLPLEVHPMVHGERRVITSHIKNDSNTPMYLAIPNGVVAELYLLYGGERPSSSLNEAYAYAVEWVLLWGDLVYETKKVKVYVLAPGQSTELQLHGIKPLNCPRLEAWFGTYAKVEVEKIINDNLRVSYSDYGMLPLRDFNISYVPGWYNIPVITKRGDRRRTRRRRCLD